MQKSNHIDRVVQPPSNWIGLSILVAFGTLVCIFFGVWLTPESQTSSKNLNSLASEKPNSQVSEPLNAKETSAPSIFSKLPTAKSVERIRIELPQMAEQLASRFASSPSALHVSALTYAELKQFTKAESRWRQCLELLPKDSGPYVGLASVLIDRGEDVEALSVLELVRARANPSSQFFQTFSEALSRTGDLSGAKEVLLEGVELIPEDGKLWYQLGTVDIQLQNLPEAEKSLRNSILVSGGSISVRNSLIGVLARLGRLQEAIELRDQNQKQDCRKGPVPRAVRLGIERDCLTPFQIGCECGDGGGERFTG